MFCHKTGTRTELFCRQQLQRSCFLRDNPREFFYFQLCPFLVQLQFQSSWLKHPESKVVNNVFSGSFEHYLKYIQISTFDKNLFLASIFWIFGNLVRCNFLSQPLYFWVKMFGHEQQSRFYSRSNRVRNWSTQVHTCRYEVRGKPCLELGIEIG